MIAVPAYKVRQFGVEFYETSSMSGDIQRLVKFEVLGKPNKKSTGFNELGGFFRLEV